MQNTNKNTLRTTNKNVSIKYVPVVDIASRRAFSMLDFCCFALLAVVELFRYVKQVFNNEIFAWSLENVFCGKNEIFCPRSTSFGFIDYRVNKFSTCWCSVDGKSKFYNGLLPSRLIINHSTLRRKKRRNILTKLSAKFPISLKHFSILLSTKFSTTNANFKLDYDKQLNTKANLKLSARFH